MVHFEGSVVVVCREKCTVLDSNVCKYIYIYILKIKIRVHIVTRLE